METVEKQTAFSHRSHSPCCYKSTSKAAKPKTKPDRLHKIFDATLLNAVRKLSFMARLS
jgi:hypothetical protein